MNHHFKTNRIITLVCVTIFLLGALVSTAQTKDEIINTSYLTAFGKFATAGELTYWRQNVGNQSIPQMVANHKAYLKSSPAEQAKVVRQSYLDAFGWPAQEGEVNYWVPQNQTYAQLMNIHVSNWLQSNPDVRKNVIIGSYNKVFGRAPNNGEINYWMGVRPCSFVELVAMHTTFKQQNQQTSSQTLIAPGLNTSLVSTAALSPEAYAGMVAAGGGNLLAGSGGYMVAAGGGNMVAAGGGN